jgi:hypothetical protein
VHFENTRTIERVDRNPLPAPALPGLFSSSALLATESRFAETDFEPAA